MNKVQKWFFGLAGIALLVCALRVLSLPGTMLHKMALTAGYWTLMSAGFAIAYLYFERPRAVEIPVRRRERRLHRRHGY